MHFKRRELHNHHALLPVVVVVRRFCAAPALAAAASLDEETCSCSVAAAIAGWRCGPSPSSTRHASPRRLARDAALPERKLLVKVLLPDASFISLRQAVVDARVSRSEPARPPHAAALL